MKRRKFTSTLKAKLVLEALSERYTLSRLTERHKLHPNQISQWKSQFLSMDSKGRATDNTFIETLWKSIKYEKIYLNPTDGGLQLYQMVEEYFTYYNHERKHSSLEDQNPISVYEKAV